MNWKYLFETLSDEELDKLALLRVIECSNGVIQYLYRDEEEDALSIEETRIAMNFSMTCIKKMMIPVNGEEITFAPETEEIFTEMRRLYISGAKNNNEEDYQEFLKGSKASLIACGKERIHAAREIAFDHLIDKIPPHALDWGVSYIYNFTGW